MEELTLLSISTFHSAQQYANPVPNRQFSTFEIAVVDGVGRFTESVVAEAQLQRWLSTDATVSTNALHSSPQNVQASLKLICIPRNLDVSLEVSQDVFRELLDTMQINPAALYLLCRDYDGFHQTSDASHRRTWLFGTAVHATLWTFDHASNPPRTMAIYFQRRRTISSSFGEVLRTFSNHVCVPQLLILVVSLHLMMHWFDEDVTTELQRIRGIEDATGFRGARDFRSEKNPYFRATKVDIDALTDYSQGVNEIAGQLSNKLRHQRMIKMALEHICTDPANLDGLSTHTIPDPNSSSHKNLCALKYAVPTVISRLDIYAEYLKYLRDRSERLSVVLFALLTHQDAAASIALGIASKRDTSSMKTIAVVTMAFLPATFIAALFAVPSLDWKGDTVMSSRFWVYWAFTIPMTTLVFGIWLGITQGQWLSNLLRPSESVP